MRRWVVFVVAVFALVFASGCDSPPSPAGAPAPTGAVEAPGTTFAPAQVGDGGLGGTTPGTVAPPASVPGPDPRVDVSPAPAAPAAVEQATAVVTDLRPSLPYTDTEAACVVDHLSRDASLLDRTRQGVGADTPAFQGVVQLGQVCVQAVTFAPLFADQVQASAGGALTEAQLACLREKYAALPAEVLTAMSAGALDPASPKRAELSAQLDALVGSCGVTPPK